jgi:entericidin B
LPPGAPASSTNIPFLLKIAKIPSSVDGLSMLIGHENKTDTKDDIMVKKTIAAFFTVLVLSSALTACNTTRGVGQDISEGGSAISGAATKAQQ